MSVGRLGSSDLTKGSQYILGTLVFLQSFLFFLFFHSRGQLILMIEEVFVFLKKHYAESVWMSRTVHVGERVFV